MSLKRYRTDTGAPWPYPAGRDPVGVYGQDGSLYIGALPPRMAYDAASGLDPSSAGYRHPSEPSTFQPARELPATSAAGMGQREATDQGDGGEGNRGAGISRARERTRFGRRHARRLGTRRLWRSYCVAHGALSENDLAP
jgi:hypothetical protein